MSDPLSCIPDVRNATSTSWVPGTTTSTLSGPLRTCDFCGVLTSHLLTACPRVREVEFFPDGRVKRVEKFAPRAEESRRPQPTPNWPWPGVFYGASAAYSF